MKIVGSEMTHSLIMVSAKASLDEAFDLMFRNKIRHLPVCDANDRIIGILSERDLERAMASDVADAKDARYETIKFPSNVLVQDYMSAPVRTFAADTDMSIVIDQMLQDKVSAYLLTNADRVVGIITSDDFLYLLKRILDEQDETEHSRVGDILTTPFVGRVAQMVSDAGI